ncbi:MAG: hypothetical protein ACJ72H_07150 [Candidatus Sulfotelmatobacter sp.]
MGPVCMPQPLSKIRAGGLSYNEAAFRLEYLLRKARLQGRSGVTVKDLSVWMEDARIVGSIPDSEHEH